MNHSRQKCKGNVSMPTKEIVTAVKVVHISKRLPKIEKWKKKMLMIFDIRRNNGLSFCPFFSLVHALVLSGLFTAKFPCWTSTLEPTNKKTRLKDGMNPKILPTTIQPTNISFFKCNIDEHFNEPKKNTLLYLFLFDDVFFLFHFALCSQKHFFVHISWALHRYWKRNAKNVNQQKKQTYTHTHALVPNEMQ